MLDYKFEHCDSYYQCYLKYGTMTFYGEARCHPEDEDMKSERTGYFIAECRANLQLMRWRRDYEIMPMVKEYKHLYNSLAQSPKFDKESCAAKAILREWKKWERELEATREDIKNEKNYLRNYIIEKDKLHNKIRKGKNS